MSLPARQRGDLEGLVGRVLVDRYRVDELVGVGGMGAVFKGHQLTLKRNVAIKVLHPELIRDEQIAKRFEREAESAARLEHPNIIQVLEQGTTEDGFKFIVMQLLEGGELATRLSDPVPPAQAVVWALQIFDALAHAHEHGIIHRDLKPENVFVSTDHDGREILKLVDFGIAKIVDGSTEAAEPMTQLGLVFGTPAYMSPEQATGLSIDERTDLYSAGVILYQMLAGQPPFWSPDPVALIRMQVSLDPPPLPDHVPAELSSLVVRLLAKQREERYSSAAEVRTALEAALRGLDLEGLAIPAHIAGDVSGMLSSAESRPASGRPARRPRRIRRLFAAGLLIAVGTLGVLAATRSGLLARVVSDAAAVDPVTPATEAAAALDGGPPADELAELDRLLLARSPDAALELLAPLRQRYPDDASLAWREGKALSLKKGKRELALARYGEALERDAGLLQNAEFYAELHALLQDRRLRSPAVELALSHLGRSGHPFLLALVNERDPDRALRYDERRRALAELSTVPESRALIDQRLNLARDLWQAQHAPRPCAAYREALVGVSVAPDPLYLATLRARAVPKDGPDPADRALCVEVAPLREQVLAAYELAYGEPGPADALAEPAPAEKKPEGKPAPSKKAPAKKKTAPPPKKKPFQKFGDKLDEVFGGKKRG
jgi:tRNA A-37 threonylcarbamoyl transferase component Bud32